MIQTYFLHRSAFRSAMYEKQAYSKYARQQMEFYSKVLETKKIYEQLYRKHFKKTYAGKPTKRFINLWNKLRKADEGMEEEILEYFKPKAVGSTKCKKINMPFPSWLLLLLFYTIAYYKQADLRQITNSSSFAWETNSSIIHKAGEAKKTLEYWGNRLFFPFFNRNVDRNILAPMPQLQRIYVQDRSPNSPTNYHLKALK